MPEIAPQTLEGRSEDDIKRLGARAQKLLEKNPRVAKAFFSMIASVRLYNVALAAINDECIHNKLGDDSGAIAFILANSVRKVTAKEFERRELAQHIQQHALEFMAMELSLEEKRDDMVLREDLEREVELRKEQLVAVSHALVRPDGYFGIDRSRSIFLVGARDVLREIVEETVGIANINKQTVIRLLSTMKQHTDVSRAANTNQWRFELGQQHWINFADSHRKVGELMNRMAHKLRGNRVDLLVVEDISQATDATSQLPPQLRSNGAQRAIRRYADENGTAVICCLPLEDADPADKAWDRLEVYTELRFVGRDANGNIEIETRDGKSWLGIPEVSLGDTDEHSDSGLPDGSARELGEPGAASEAAEDSQEAGDD